MNQKEPVVRVPEAEFSILAVELKLRIFEYVLSKYDHANMRFVCQEWAHLIRLLVWKTFKTSLSGDLASRMGTLPEEQRLRFRDIRNLVAGGRHAGPDYATHFSTLLGLFRQDQLHGFQSGKQTPLSSTQLVRILQRQSKLQSLQARIDLSDVDTLHRRDWISEQTPLLKSALSSLQHLRIYIGDRNPHEVEDHQLQALQNLEMSCNRLLLESTPKLDSLEICVWRPHVEIPRHRDRAILSRRILFADNESLLRNPPTLTRLLLADMDLLGATHFLTRISDLTALTSLRLEFCDNIGSFLETFADSFQHTSPKLKTLTIRPSKFEDEQHADYWHIRDGLRDLLCLFTGLEELQVDTVECESFDWDPLAHHESLKKLIVASSSMYSRGGTGSLRKILAPCPHLEYFGFRVPILLAGNISRDGALLNPLDTRLSLFLDILAKSQTIHTLHLLYAPGDLGEYQSSRGDPGWIERVSQRAHRGATVVLGHLHSEGSKINMLVLAPSSRWEQRSGDRNLHYYPFYFYKLHVRHVDGGRVIEAVPIRNYQAENPEAVGFR